MIRQTRELQNFPIRPALRLSGRYHFAGWWDFLYGSSKSIGWKTVLLVNR
jgi:hypothetical protein